MGAWVGAGVGLGVGAGVGSGVGVIVNSIPGAGAHLEDFPLDEDPYPLPLFPLFPLDEDPLGA